MQNNIGSIALGKSGGWEMAQSTCLSKTSTWSSIWHQGLAVSVLAVAPVRVLSAQVWQTNLDVGSHFCPAAYRPRDFGQVTSSL